MKETALEDLEDIQSIGSTYNQELRVEEDGQRQFAAGRISMAKDVVRYLRQSFPELRTLIDQETTIVESRYPPDGFYVMGYTHAMQRFMKMLENETEELDKELTKI